MPYLIDTDIYVYLSTGNRQILENIKAVGEENIFISSITVAELYYGAFFSAKHQDNLKKLQIHLDELQVLNFTKNTAKVFGRLKCDLRKTGKPIADMDLAIASIALYHQYTLVTHNTRHFSHVPELVLEDWT